MDEVRLPIYHQALMPSYLSHSEEDLALLYKTASSISNPTLAKDYWGFQPEDPKKDLTNLLEIKFPDLMDPKINKDFKSPQQAILFIFNLGMARARKRNYVLPKENPLYGNHIAEKYIERISEAIEDAHM